MTNETRDLADQDSAIIRAEIDDTRSAITTKLEALEEQVVGTMQSAKESVQETIETVRGTVEDTVSTVKETLDVRLQVQRHPWAMVGGSWVAGLVVGAVVGGARHRRRMPMDRLASYAASDKHHQEAVDRLQKPTVRNVADNGSRTEQPPEPGLFDRFHGEIEQVKGLAIGMALGLVRDVIKQNLPQLEQQVGEIMDGITTKLGGQPVRGRVLEK